MFSQEWPQFSFKPPTVKRSVRPKDTDRVHGWLNTKLAAQVRFYIRNHLFSIGGAEQIGLADENHGARTRLIKRLHYDEIILGEARARIDQNNTEITPRQVRDCFLRASNCERAKSWCIDEGNAFRQAIRR